MSRKRTTEEFIKLAKEKHGDKYDYSLVEYKSKEDDVNIICKKHGVFSQKAALHLKGSGCRACSYEARGKMFRKKLDIFINEANLKHNNFYSYDKFEYINAHEPSTITCPIHGDFLMCPNYHLQGQGCNKCNQSHLENELMSFLIKNNINFEYQKKFDWLGKQSLDFYLLDYNIGIECQGKQHFGKGGWSDNYDFNEIYKRDIKKYELCKNHDIKLIYFTKEKNVFNDLYNQDNTINSVNLMYNILDIKTNIDDLYSFFNKINNNNNISLFGYELNKFSELYVSNNYMLNITKEFNDMNKRAIHIFEDEWLNKKHIIKSILKSILHLSDNRIYARKCEIREVSSNDSKIFLVENHLQGNCSSKYRYGLYYNNELVSLMTFGCLRKNLGSKSSEDTYELLRFCNKLNTNVIGGASKLFNYFIKEHNPSEIISYCDRRWSQGNMYNILGFELDHVSRPNYYYIINGKRENRFGFRKDILIKQGFDKNKTEHEIMLERKIYRIYDCGCNVYKFINNKFNVIT